MKEKNLYNPLFESLIDSAHRYQKGPDFMVKEEDEGTKMSKNDIIKYLSQINVMFSQNIIMQLLAYPFPETRKELTKIVLENLAKLKDNQSLDSLVEGFKKIFNEAVTKIAADKKMNVVKPIFDEVKLGMADLLKAYETLKKRAGSLIADQEILKDINAKMVTYSDALLKSVEDSKKVSSDGRSNAESLF